MKKNTIHLLGLLCFSVLIFLQIRSLECGIEEIDSFDQVDFEDLGRSSNKLVVFDVDDTLVHPSDAYWAYENTPQGRLLHEKLLKKYSAITSKEWRDIGSIRVKEASRPLIEEEVIEHINILKKNNIPIIACTAMNTGPYGVLATMEQWRYEHLKSLGFEGSFTSIFSLKSPYSGCNPQFYKSILVTDSAEKGPVIGDFLDEMNLQFNEIVMFDDNNKFLESVEQECEKRGIVFTGYLYNGAFFVEKKLWDEELLTFQAEYLIKNKKWLNDNKARELLVLNKDKQIENDILTLGVNLGLGILTNL